MLFDGWSRILREQDGEGSGGGGGDGGGEGGKPEPKFTQADVDKLLGQRLNQERSKFKDYEALKEQAAKAAEFEQKIAEMQAQIEDSTKSEAEKLKAANERAIAARERKEQELQQQIASASAQTESWKKRYFDREVQSSMGAALDGLSVAQASRADALALFHMLSKVDHDEEGQITSIDYAGVPYTKIEDAAKAFLESRPHMVSVKNPPVGGGTKPPNAGGRQELSGSVESLISQGLSSRLR